MALPCLMTSVTLGFAATLLPPIPVPGLWTLAQTLTPDAPIALLAIAVALGATVALTAALARNPPYGGKARAAAAILAIAIPGMTMPDMGLVSIVAALPFTLWLLRQKERLPALLFGLALAETLACAPAVGSVALLAALIAATRILVTPHAANDNLPIINASPFAGVALNLDYVSLSAKN
ncbi:hypothetical protein GCM10023219_09570 [Stakelama sediminis]